MDSDVPEMSVRVVELTLDTLMPRDLDSHASRMLRYTSADHEIVVDVTTEAASVALAIRVTPPGRVGIDVRPLHGTSRRVWAGVDGETHCRAVPLGPMSLLVHWPASAGGAVRTVWTQV